MLRYGKTEDRQRHRWSPAHSGLFDWPFSRRDLPARACHLRLLTALSDCMPWLICYHITQKTIPYSSSIRFTGHVVRHLGHLCRIPDAGAIYRTRTKGKSARAPSPPPPGTYQTCPMTDLQELYRAHEERVLRWHHLPPDNSRQSSRGFTVRSEEADVVSGRRRTLWCKAEILREREGEERRYTGRNCKYIKDYLFCRKSLLPSGSRSADEIHPELRFVGAGILAMANSGPNTNGNRPSDASHPTPLTKRFAGSQFFLTLAPTPWLDGKHTIFGRVHSGMPTLQRLAAVRTDGNDKYVSLTLPLLRAAVLTGCVVI